MKPTLASGVRINGNILLKGIASTGAVYVRLLVEDDSDEVDSGIHVRGFFINIVMQRASS